ncbi:MAG: DUF4153 domain-containing protein [Firmicutes bacterium]|nr:DUF4153 domain-containing protein [Bacillota bacterium]
MKIKKLIKNTLLGLYKSTKRFPITVCISSILAIMLIVMTEMANTLDENTLEILQRISMILALGIPFSLCIKFIFEKRNITNYKKILGYALGALILIGYYFFLLKDFDMVSITRYIGVTVFLYLAFMYIPRVNNKDYYEYYVIKVLSSFLLTVIYSVVLYLGLVFIIFSVDKLFLVNMSEKIYIQVFFVVSLVFGVTMFLAKIPFNKQDFSNSNYPKALKILILYILIPLITVYTAILYAYFIKIIVTMNWPVGLVSHLVLWFSVISVAVIFFIYPIIKEKKLAKNFVNYFPKAIIPILIMMFISIGIRIRAYGFTENRYYVLVLGMWVLGIIIYFCFSKKNRNIIIPISLSILVLNSVFGPLSGYSISKLSQNNRLEDILIRNDMLVGKKIVSSTKISKKDKTEISNILRYFKNNHNLDDVRYISNDFQIKNMEDTFGFPFTNIKDIRKNRYFNYSNYGNAKVINTEGYDYLIDLNNSENKVNLNDSIKVIYNRSSYNLKIMEGEKVIYNKDLFEYADILNKKYKDLSKRKSIDLKEMTFIDENERVNVTFVFKSISGTKEVSEEIKVNHMDFYFLIKIK